ncbi:MAG: DUF917 domain-containing protein, partial [Spirochaetota bacterium]
MRKLGKQAMQDIVIGAGLFGAGGGGSTAEGMQLVERILDFGSGVDLATIDEIKAHEWGAVIAGVGSPKASLTRVRTYSPAYALDLLENTCGFKSSFVIPFELGAGNSLNPMLAAVQKNIPIVDGDPAGRAVPELQINTFYLGGIALAPLALSTEDKISAVIRTEKPYDTERVARAITAELGGVAAIACHAMQGKDMRKHIISGTTSLAEKIGRTIRKAQTQGEDAAENLVKNFNGYILGKGRITSIKGETKGGFDFGVVTVEGALPIRVQYKNENMLAFRGEKLLAVVPDLICSLDERGNPLTNA